MKMIVDEDLSLSSQSSEEEPFSLHYVPLHLQLGILEKFTHPDFVEFAQCNSYSNDLADRKPAMLFDEEVNRVIFHNDNEEVAKNVNEVVSKYPLEEVKRARLLPKYLEIQRELTDEACESIIDHLRRKQIRCSGVTIERGISCDVDSFRRLLQATQCDVLLLPRGTDGKYLWMKEVLQKKKLCIMEDADISDDILHRLEATELRLYGTRVSTAGMIKFFKEWLSGTREIHHFFIRSENQIKNEEIVASLREFSVTESPQQMVISRANGDKLVIAFGWALIAFLAE